MRELAHRIAHARRLQYLLVALIVGSGVLQGLAYQFDLEQYYTWIGTAWLLTIATLVAEALLKIFALSPRAHRYFMDGRNIFDFLVVCFLLIGLTVYSPAADYAVIIMWARLLRLLRSLAIIQGVRLLLTVLFRSVRSVANVALLMGVIIYAYALVGIILFGENDPARWGNLGAAASTLFQILTLDNWAAIMRSANEAAPFAWVYFVSFVIISGFVVTNIFIAMVIKNLDEYHEEQALAASASTEEILRELRAAQQSLRNLEKRLREISD